MDRMKAVGRPVLSLSASLGVRLPRRLAYHAVSAPSGKMDFGLEQ